MTPVQIQPLVTLIKTVVVLTDIMMQVLLFALNVPLSARLVQPQQHAQVASLKIIELSQMGFASAKLASIKWSTLTVH